MVKGTSFVGNLIFVLIIGYCFGLELESDETTLSKHLNAVVQYGKRLKIHIENSNFPKYYWQFNGTSVSEKCEVKSSTLICSDMDWSDGGLYEIHGITRSGHRETLLSVHVIVVECEKSAKQQTEDVESVDSNINIPCFCFEVTSKCQMANNLFRSKITGYLLHGNMKSQKLPNTSESQAATYYSLPKQFTGNLLKSYGGFLDIEEIQGDVSHDGPDVVLHGSSTTLIYRYNLENTVSGELNRKRIQMTEQDWRDLNGSYVSRETFMTALSNVREIYIKSNPSRDLESLQIVLDSAAEKDQGLGKVTTVEKCACGPGYKGLSCEACSDGYVRRQIVGYHEVCLSLRDLRIIRS